MHYFNKGVIGKLILLIILVMWLLSLAPGLLLERRNIRGRLTYFAFKNSEQKEQEVTRQELLISGEGEMYILVKDYINRQKNGPN